MISSVWILIFRISDEKLWLGDGSNIFFVDSCVFEKWIGDDNIVDNCCMSSSDDGGQSESLFNEYGLIDNFFEG